MERIDLHGNIATLHITTYENINRVLLFKLKRFILSKTDRLVHELNHNVHGPIIERLKTSTYTNVS